VAAVRSRAAAAGHAGRAQAGGGAAAASSKVNPRDLLLPADQSKQDEVFIGGLPSHWKAQQVSHIGRTYSRLRLGGAANRTFAREPLVWVQQQKGLATE
jgi:hypothetical protein